MAKSPSINFIIFIALNLAIPFVYDNTIYHFFNMIMFVWFYLLFCSE